MKNKIFKIGLLASMLLGACSESLLDKVNPNGGTPESYYGTEDELIKGVNAIYAAVQSNSLVAREWFFLHDLRSDDAASGGGQLEGQRAAVLNGANDPANSVSGAVWQGYFIVVHRANSVIGGSANTLNIDEAVKTRIVAEARFLRAYAYADLLALWGGVPLYTETVTSPLGGKPRSTVDEVNQFLIDELTAIQADLPLSYPSSDLGRVTKGASQALLARVYMSANDYANAKIELNKIVSSAQYSLVNAYVDNFKEETGFNTESIFEIGFFNSDVNWTGDGDIPSWGGVLEGNTRTQEYSSVGWRNVIPSDALLADYESTFKGDAKTDPRFAVSFIRHGDPTASGTLDTATVQGNKSNFEGTKQKISWRKYTSIYKSTATYYTGPMDMRIIRYAEVLLNLAECENELGNSAAAITLLNQVRSRASVAMPAYPTAAYPANSKAEVFKAIVHERRVELGGEQIRNKDILRWRKQGKLTTDPISYFQANKFEFLPIPNTELATNPNITQADQNPGY